MTACDLAKAVGIAPDEAAAPVTADGGTQEASVAPEAP